MSGHWYCRQCHAQVDLNLDGEMPRCATCGSPYVSLTRGDPVAGERAPQPSEPISPEQARSLFAAMRAAVNT